MKVYIHVIGTGHMTKMPTPCQYMVKNFFCFLENQKSDDLKIWYGESEAQGQQNLYKYDDFLCCAVPSGGRKMSPCTNI